MYATVWGGGVCRKRTTSIKKPYFRGYCYYLDFGPLDCLQKNLDETKEKSGRFLKKTGRFLKSWTFFLKIVLNNLDDLNNLDVF